MSKRWARLTALLLTLLLLVGCGKETKTGPESQSTSAPAPSVTAAPSPAASASPPPTETPSPEAAQTPAPTPELPASRGLLDETGWPSTDGIHADVDFADMHWYLYDMSQFEARAEELARTEDEDRAEELYDWLLTEYKRILTLDELAWIGYYADGSPEDAERCRLSDELASTAYDVFFTAAAGAVDGPTGDIFSSWLGEELSHALSGFEGIPDRNQELHARENELVLAYNELLGREDLSQSELGTQAGEILLELIALRNEKAEILGYDSFAEMAYYEYYARDYIPEDAAAFCEAVRPYARTYYEDCSYCTALSRDLGTSAVKEPTELIAMLHHYAPLISPQAEEAERYMEEHGLYFLGSAEESTDIGYVCDLSYYNAPFLFNSLHGSIFDIGSVFHEFGHYYDAYLNRLSNPLLQVPSSDIFEIHSTGLEALSYFWYDELFGDTAEEARIYCLNSLIHAVISGCINDEFQRYIYAHPEMTVEDICKAYVDICQSYGVQSAPWELRWNWATINHTFESPFYYFSYTASAVVALQLWSLAYDEMDTAILYYNRLVEEGAFDKGYCELLTELGLSVFADDPDACIAAPFRELRKMCLRYDGRLGLQNLIPAA